MSYESEIEAAKRNVRESARAVESQRIVVAELPRFSRQAREAREELRILLESAADYAAYLKALQARAR